MDARKRRRRFDELAGEALDRLPRWVQERMENVEVLVEELPPADAPNLLGLYEGVPLTNRGWGYGVGGTLPDRITLFRATLEAGDPTADELRDRIRHTIVHEVAHFFGISDDRLREIDRY
ncbi:MAG TPA: metallopeptidase family protein [Actinomycetota bacterium]|nr:metallopeptidase family protein [Actinomycetota bacterium]